jgi:hypothetical protein
MPKDDGWPTLDEERELYRSMVAEAEQELAHAREQLRRVEHDIAQRDLQKPDGK